MYVLDTDHHCQRHDPVIAESVRFRACSQLGRGRLDDLIENGHVAAGYIADYG